MQGRRLELGRVRLWKLGVVVRVTRLRTSTAAFVYEQSRGQRVVVACCGDF